MKPQTREEVEQRAEKMRNRSYIDMLSQDNLMRNLPQENITLDYDSHTLTFEYGIREWMLNTGGALHGGVIAMCADIACGFATQVFAGRYTPTVELSVSYLRPGSLSDETLVIAATAEHVGKAVSHVTAKIRSKVTGKLLATVKGVYYTGLEEKEHQR